MAKLDVPRYLTAKTLGDGRTVAYYWQPSPKLRKAGWKSLSLGTDLSRAIASAETRNREVDGWVAGGAAPKAVRKAVAPATMGALIDRYRRDRMADEARARDFKEPLSPETVRQYEYAFGKILYWAEDGRTRLADITTDAVETLKRTLFGAKSKDGAMKRHRAVAILRVLRMLLNFAADQRLIAANPMDGVSVPQPPPRDRIIAPAAIDAVRASAVALGRPDIALGVLLGLWTLQREADILSWTRTANWRPCTDMAEESRRVLVGADGRVMGVRLRQRKTRKWIEVPAIAALRSEVEAALAASAARATPVLALVADPDEARATPQWKFQRGFRAAVDNARAAALAADDEKLADELTGIQFRDLRRTGMCLLRELGMTPAWIANLSGHSIEETSKILETYMPADPRTAAAAIAMLTTRLAEREAIDKERSA